MMTDDAGRITGKSGMGRNIPEDYGISVGAEYRNVIMMQHGASFHT
jgi:hypothetical protein